MAKPFASRTLKVMEYFRKNPDAVVSAVAGKFNMAISTAYQLRAKVRKEEPAAEPEARKRIILDPKQEKIARALGVPLEEYVKKGLELGALKYEGEKVVLNTEWRLPESLWKSPEDNPITNVDAILDSRAKDYGKFIDGAEVMQMLKRIVHTYIEMRDTQLAFDQREALDMIIHKIGRIINGNPDKADHWFDVAGYATLVAERLEGNAR